MYTNSSYHWVILIFLILGFSSHHLHFYLFKLLFAPLLTHQYYI
eukprot:UN07934